MKKILLLLACIYTASLVSAQTPQPSACVNITTGYVCNPSTLGFISPCQTVPFVVTNYLPVPTGYAIVGKFEWFVNGVSVKITTDASDPVLQ